MYWQLLFVGSGRRCLRWLLLALLWSSSTLHAAEGLTFDQALKQALRDSPELQAESARVEAARQAEGPADALPDPTLILGLDNVPVEGPDRYSLSSDFMTMRRIGVTQRFPNRSKRKARSSGASQRVGLAEAMAANARLKVLRQTARAWIARYTLEQQLQLIDQLLEENRLLDKAVRARLAAGQGKMIDSVAPAQEQATLLNRRDLLQTRQRQASADLVRWLGQAGQRTLAGSPPMLTVDPELLLARLHQHPELGVAQRQEKVAIAAVDEARAARKPDWALTLAYMDREEFSDMAMLQVNVDLPLFTGTRQSPRIASAEAERRALELQTDALLREHEAMLYADLAEFDRLQRVLARQLDVLLPLAEQKAELAGAAWRSGEGSLADLVQARSELLDTRLTEIALTGQRDQQAAALHFTYEHHDVASEEHGDEY
jgi:outer membrane protein TolC